MKGSSLSIQRQAEIRLKRSSMSQPFVQNDFSVPKLNANSARQLVDRSINESKTESNQFKGLREDLALKQLAMVLCEIEKKALAGKTQIEWVIRDRSIAAEHRDEVIQILKSHLDYRGFNVLSYWYKTILGGQTTLQIEW